MKLTDSSRRTKRLIFFVADTALVTIALYGAFAFRYGTLTPMGLTAQSWALFPLMTLFGALLIYTLRLPRIKLDTFEIRGIMQIALVAVLLTPTAMVCSYILALPTPRSVPVLFGSMFFIASVIMRIAGLSMLRYLDGRDGDKVRVAIYGAGSAGIQMAAALRQARETRPVLFIDDNATMQKLMVAGLPVHSPARLAGLVAQYGIDRVLIAIPSISKARQKELLQSMADLPIDVQILPSYVDMMAGNGKADAFRPVSPEALLGRDKVDLDAPEIADAYAGRVVMVTGAGGSIGSELCRQLLNCRPARIILFDQGEFQLYSIDQELRAQAMATGIPVVACLGSVTNKARVASVVADESVEIIVHSAAYKHVPLVEGNELEGARNNVLGTFVVTQVANAANIERMILISTDKAVRPTNIMGATKRLAELVLQDMQTRAGVTKFAMVRFGNVLGSSGSVLPLFQEQIARGGPVTVTHADVTRFFMTIPEAARLVLLAGAYATGGDVFVLDMGKPQKIIDIARQMIRLSGNDVIDPVTGKGDIAIEITGLRPGEKLYEELLIDNDSLVATPHPKILRAEEAMLSQTEMADIIAELEASLAAGDKARLRNLIATRVDGYHRQGADAGSQG